MFGKLLYNKRKERNISQQKLADELNARYATSISKSMISRWEKSIADPQMDYVRIIADYLDLNIYELFNEPTTAPKIRDTTQIEQLLQQIMDGLDNNGHLEHDILGFSLWSDEDKAEFADILRTAIRAANRINEKYVK